MTKYFFYDLETTGLSAYKSGIHELSFILAVRSGNSFRIVLQQTLHMKPFEGAEISPEALAVGGVTKEQLNSYQSESDAYRELMKTLNSHVNKFNKKDKMFLCGYNNTSFDDQFFRQFFKRNNDNFFGSYFWGESLDCRTLAAEKLLVERNQMIDFKLATVAKEFGITVQEEHLHTASYDVLLTMKIYEEVMRKASILVGFVCKDEQGCSFYNTLQDLEDDGKFTIKDALPITKLET